MLRAARVTHVTRCAAPASARPVPLPVSSPTARLPGVVHATPSPLGPLWVASAGPNATLPRVYRRPNSTAASRKNPASLPLLAVPGTEKVSRRPPPPLLAATVVARRSLAPIFSHHVAPFRRGARPGGSSAMHMAQSQGRSYASGGSALPSSTGPRFAVRQAAELELTTVGRDYDIVQLLTIARRNHAAARTGGEPELAYSTQMTGAGKTVFGENVLKLLLADLARPESQQRIVPKLLKGRWA